MKEMLGSAQAAEYLHAARQTLAKWRISGKGPRWAKWGRSVYYDRADLDAWIEASKRTSTSSTSVTSSG